MSDYAWSQRQTEQTNDDNELAEIARESGGVMMKITSRVEEIKQNSLVVNEQVVIFEYAIVEDNDFTTIPYEQGTVVIFLYCPGDEENPPGMNSGVLNGTMQSAAINGNISQKFQMFPERNVIADVRVENGDIYMPDYFLPNSIATAIVNQREKKWRKYLEAQDSLIE
jgi:hypothetical protein